MNVSFNKAFYKSPSFYLFIFSSILFLKQGLFQRSMVIAILAVGLLVFQLFLALTEPVLDRARDKWLTLVFLLLSLCLLLQGCSFSKQAVATPSLDTSSRTEDTARAMEESAIKQYHSIVSQYTPLTIEELVNDSFPRDSLLFLWKASCPYCRDFLPLFQETMQKLDVVQTVYYYNVEGMTEEDKKQVLTKFPIVGVPALIYLKEDGTYNLLDETETSLSDWLYSLPKEE
ncbi:thioredoxin family protein [Streptococcus suis]|uniref:TlpA family protein disulfide reductase n=1 Tax=Streptococcus suis TaxID=1307 RepID=UPI001C97C23C|nr:thioredoxin family protein [Streptococcus suis]MBY4981106.1 thioredoxin family protein [Streptococcus suis]MBY4991906.1 thioredoxin family protein [Streptococcus suis]MBY5007214.1 thioredoxin family protein [Streptococcus suis]